MNRFFRVALVTTSLLPMVAHAQEGAPAAADDANGGMPDIVVTATKTGAQSLQKVPLAITAFSAETIAQMGAASLVNVAQVTPGFAYTFNGPWSIASIRGVGTNNVFAGGDPSTTLQVDGVYYARPTGANVDFLDFERVEVLRGPQGTLYGRNVIGGTVNILTKDPTDELRGEVKMTIGNYMLVRPEFALSGPLANGVSFAVSGRYSYHDFYTKELNPSLKDGWNENRWGVRGKLKFDVSPGVDIILAADYSKADEYFNSFTVRRSAPFIPDGLNPGFHESALSAPNQGITEQYGTSAKIAADLGGATLTSITAYRESNADFEADLDFTAVDLFHTRAFVENQSQLSQELTLSGNIGGVTYVVGAFGMRERAVSYYGAVVFGSVLQTQGINALTKSGAVFGQVDIPVGDKLKFTAGVRYTHDEKDVENIFGVQTTGITNDRHQLPSNTAPIFSGGSTKGAMTPKFGVQYQASRDTLVYASVTKGYKSGGFNLLIDPSSINSAGYKPEYVWAYEAGLKLGIPSIGGRLNIATFYNDYKGLQVNQFVFDPVSGTTNQLVNNAKKAKIKGIELEGAFQPTDAVEFGGSLAYLDAKYKGSFPAINNFTSGPVNPDGKRLNDAPRWSGSAYLQYNASLGSSTDLHLRGGATYKGDVFYTPLNDIRLGSEAHWLFNAGLTIESKTNGLSGGIRVDNITDKNYVVATYAAFSAGAMPGEPRTVRGFVSYKF
ncbi:iron complex outermembrane receptor protein [Sphingobium subterraneum]|uniref:Iron complex outermembrane receptor protein n=2 Tax=Sphingobium subterraneum TaxID=627688 RepID=A0A841IYC9_9SPHN|nr:iron complex outermembrane receptor protein [Sphingobium subterraneum]